MSNGRFKSIKHRVATNGSKTRVSVPIFVNLRPSDFIGPLPQVLTSGEKAMCKDVLYSDYVKHFFRKPYDGKMTVELWVLRINSHYSWLPFQAPLSLPSASTRAGFWAFASSTL
ncbi:Feruloyl CoA ortho-hydroxylase 2 [Spatholobus suberectus]|nr:Feruloyl CoA ortho-hydroxylase 2 [Spatholobus suberectus]